MYRIKNWDKFQHYKKNNSDAQFPWIKLYRTILDDHEWHMLQPDSAKLLIELWLLGSETGGCLPDINKISFRLRRTERNVNDLISTLSHWVYNDSSETLEKDYANSDREGEEKERRGEEKESAQAHFSKFWEHYPKKKAKQDAFKAYLKIKPTQALADQILAAVSNQKKQDDWIKEGGKYIPLPASWLNGRRWEDEVISFGPRQFTKDEIREREERMKKREQELKESAERQLGLKN